MKAQAYHSWHSVVKEHLTEAIACRMAALKFGEDAAELNYVRRQYGMRWIYLHPILKALKRYEKERQQYPTLDSFIPEIINEFKKVQQSDINIWQTETAEIRKPDVSNMPVIDAIYDQKNIIFITSSNEADQEGDRKLKDFIKKMKDRMPAFKEAKIVSDTAALKMDLSGYNLSVWGTPKGNKFLQKYFGEIPLLIDDKRIIGEQRYEGSGYGILIGWVNPLNWEKIMAIYTGQNPVDIVDFNEIPNGAGNYHIFNNKITIKQSSFKRLGEIWFAK